MRRINLLSSAERMMETCANEMNIYIVCESICNYNSWIADS
jgi:hypothetical protein